jgi:hypothetical protein
MVRSASGASEGRDPGGAEAAVAHILKARRRRVPRDGDPGGARRPCVTMGEAERREDSWLARV